MSVGEAKTENADFRSNPEVGDKTPKDRGQDPESWGQAPKDTRGERHEIPRGKWCLDPGFWVLLPRGIWCLDPGVFGV